MDTMTGKTVLVTGSNDGIGKQTALELGQRGAHVLIHARSHARGDQALRELRAAAPQGTFALVVGDFASLEQVRALAGAVAEHMTPLDVLINNAGVKPTTRQESSDGFELTFAVNHLAHFVLTNALLPLLQAAPQGRVITVSSISHYRGAMYFDDLQLTRGWDSYKAYGQSKLANVLFAYALADRLAATAVTSNALHPGVVSTKLLIEGFGVQGQDSLSKGAATSVYLASSPAVAGISGRFFQDEHEQDSAALSHDRALQQRLWETSAALTSIVSST